MPKPIKITERSSSITNAFVNGIIPCIEPNEDEIVKALEILHLDPQDLRCIFCGDIATEWDHLRPLVKNKKPTGFISEIHNLVPACGKCNQSKGNKNWEEWMRSKALLSPASRNISDIEERIERLEKYEVWRIRDPINFETIVGNDLWDKHWENHAALIELMHKMQKHSDEIKHKIAEHFKNSASQI